MGDFPLLPEKISDHRHFYLIGLFRNKLIVHSIEIVCNLTLQVLTISGYPAAEKKSGFLLSKKKPEKESYNIHYAKLYI